MSLLDTRPTPSELRVESSKRLMLVSGRANPGLAKNAAEDYQREGS